MTTTQEKIAVMQAFLDGKKIEARSKSHGGVVPLELPNPVWNWGNFDYRVFQSQEEILEELLQRWFRIRCPNITISGFLKELKEKLN